MSLVEDMLQKMLRKLDARDEHTKEIRCYLDNISQKVDAYAVSIKHIK